MSRLYYLDRLVQTPVGRLSEKCGILTTPFPELRGLRPSPRLASLIESNA